MRLRLPQQIIQWHFQLLGKCQRHLARYPALQHRWSVNPIHLRRSHQKMHRHQFYHLVSIQHEKAKKKKKR